MTDHTLEDMIRRRAESCTPLRVAVVGAGASGRMVIGHLAAVGPWIQLVAVVNRTVGRGADAIRQATGQDVNEVSTPQALSSVIARRGFAAAEDPEVVCHCADVDVVVEVTGTVEYGARVVLSAMNNGKHIVLVNAELDSTLGPILATYATASGVVLTHTDGEEPGVAMGLLRYLRMVGLTPVAAGNLKGMIDQYRTPDTQRAFAEKHGMNPVKVASFADGTKLSMETCILANATGFRVGRRGMYGPRCDHVREIASRLPAEKMLQGGLVDYALGAEPHTGAFVIVHEQTPQKRKELAYYKMGDGPFYVFYTPYHLPHVQIASTIARAALGHDPTVSPVGPPVCEVAAVAKRDLKSGEILDGVGGFMTYGVIENASTFYRENLLPIGISEGCRLVHDLIKDQPVSYNSVELPSGRLCDRLRVEQSERFGLPVASHSSDLSTIPHTYEESSL